MIKVKAADTEIFSEIDSGDADRRIGLSRDSLRVKVDVAAEEALIKSGFGIDSRGSKFNFKPCMVFLFEGVVPHEMVREE